MNPSAHQHVVPAVSVEIVDVREQTVGLALCRVEWRRGKNLLALLKIGPGVPIWSGHNVDRAVAVEIARGDPVTIIRLVTEDLLLEVHLVTPSGRTDDG